MDQVFPAGLRAEELTEAMRLLGAAPPELAAVEEAAIPLGEELAAPDADMSVDDGGAAPGADMPVDDGGYGM